MKPAISITAIAFFLSASDFASGGSITGTIHAEGREIPGEGRGAGSYGSRKVKFIPRVEYEQIRDFVVHIDQPLDHPVTHPEKPVRIVVQENATFSPHVLPVMVGTTVEWPNEDDIYHNVFSFSDTKPFDLGLYKEEVKSITFDKPGRVDVFCSIHKNMNCVVLVLENPYFANTDRHGRYRIDHVPAGTYRITAWHERMPPQTLEITVPEEGEAVLDFTMGITGLPQY